MKMRRPSQRPARSLIQGHSSHMTMKTRRKVEGRKRDHIPTPSPARQQQKGKKKKRNNTVQVIVRINSHPDLSWRLKKNTTIGKIRAQIAKKYPFKSHIVHGTTILKDDEKLKDICGNWQEVFLKVVEVDGIVGGDVKTARMDDSKLQNRDGDRRIKRSKGKWKRKNKG